MLRVCLSADVCPSVRAWMSKRRTMRCFHVCSRVCSGLSAAACLTNETWPEEWSWSVPWHPFIVMQDTGTSSRRLQWTQVINHTGHTPQRCKYCVCVCLEACFHYQWLIFKPPPQHNLRTGRDENNNWQMIWGETHTCERSVLARNTLYSNAVRSLILYVVSSVRQYNEKK